MRVGVLGSLRVESGGGPLPIGGARLRSLLARLALDAGNPVGVDALSDAVWPEGGPEHPGQAVHSLVARLRRVLPDRTVLRSVAMGYRLDLVRDDVDALHFEDLAAEGHRALRAGDASTAGDLARRALGLWRGEPLSDLPPAPFVTAASARLQGLRLGAIEDRVESELLSGLDLADPDDIVRELEALVVAHPLRERFRLLLLRVLEADGRRAEALRAYEDYRILIAEELGTDPGRDLRDLHLRLLRRERTEADADPAPRTDLRTPWTSLVGRDDERSGVGEHLVRDRLVTLVGPGGVGKTRLATTVAADWAGQQSARTVALVELAQVSDPADVPYAVAVGAGVKDSGSDRDVVSRVAETLSGTETLIVLDNCEHVVDAAARLVNDLLGRCPRLRVLATSREPLGITGEVGFPVRPLGLDEAVRLFTERARAARPDIELDRLATADVCRRLDGLPLAIELAAARLRSMSPEQLVARLEDRFRLLSGGSRVDPVRHRTLRAVVEWSWDLLDDVERDAIERLVVFPAGVDQAAAEEIGIAVESLDALVDKSLLRPVDGRYRMLDTIREYGLERLAATGRAASARAAEIAYVVGLAERAEPFLRGSGQPEWVARLAAERDNLNAALRYAMSDEARDTAVRIGAALGYFWVVNGDHAEALERLRVLLPGLDAVPDDTRARVESGYLLNAVFTGELAKAAADVDVEGRRAPERPLEAFVGAMVRLASGDVDAGLAVTEAHRDDPDPWERATVHLARAFLRGSSGDITGGGRDLSAAAAGYRAAGDRWGLALALMSLASVHTASGALDEAVRALDEAMELAGELGNDDQRIWLAGIRISTGDVATARTELLDVVARVRSVRQVALARLSLAEIARLDGDLELAAELVRLADEYDAPPEDPPFHSVHRSTAGFLALERGDLDVAERRLRAALDLVAAMPDLPMVATVGVAMAALLLRRGDAISAATVLGAADRLRGGPDAGHPDVVRLTGELREFLGPEGLRTAYDAGVGMASAEALDLLRQI